MNQNKLISIIIPVYNTEKYVKEALDSIFSQTYKNFEIICIDDGSIDNSLSILESFGDKIQIIKNDKNHGTSESRNKGIHVAKGEFIAFLDADDVWTSNKLELQIKEFNNNSDLDISFTHMQCFISPELSEQAKSLRSCPSNPILGYVPSTAMIKRSSFDKVGYFDRKFKNVEFMDWINKAKEGSLNIEITKEVLLFRRIHETNLGIVDREHTRNDYLKVIKESLDRKRKNNLSSDIINL